MGNLSSIIALAYKRSHTSSQWNLGIADAQSILLVHEHLIEDVKATVWLLGRWSVDQTAATLQFGASSDIDIANRAYACTIHTNSLRICFAPCRLSGRNILINILSSFANAMFCIRLNQNDWPQQRLSSTISCDHQQLCGNFYFWPIIFKKRYLDFCFIDLG